MRALILTVLISTAALAQFSGSQPGALDGGAAVQDVSACASCHNQDSADDPTLYMPYDGWASSMMGNAMRDPLFLAALSVANQDRPGVGTFCLKCHSPQAWVRGHASDPDGGLLDRVDLQGVSCEACHRSLAIDGGFLEGNAQLEWDSTGGKLGPYDNVNSPAHSARQQLETSTSALCGQCHQIENPSVAWAGHDGGFPLDTTYEEWRHSAFAAEGTQCISCHMKTMPGQHQIALRGQLRTDPRRHTFTGGNLWGLDAIQATNPDLAPLAANFDETRAVARETLESSARLSILAPPTADPTAPIDFTVRVENLTGHKLPTGYADGRRLFLQISIDGELVSGRFDADAGTLVPDSNLRVYEAQHGRAGVGVEDHLALHDTIVRDSRIPPRGFTAIDSTRPVGVSWFDSDDGGYRNYDEVSFQIPPGSAGTGTHDIDARLLYQSTTNAYLSFLATENHSDARGAALRTLASPEPFAVARASAQIATPALPRDEPTRPSPCGCESGPDLLLPLAMWATLLRRSKRVQRRAHKPLIFR